MVNIRFSQIKKISCKKKIVYGLCKEYCFYFEWKQIFCFVLKYKMYLHEIKIYVFNRIIHLICEKLIHLGVTNDSNFFKLIQSITFFSVCFDYCFAHSWHSLHELHEVVTWNGFPTVLKEFPEMLSTFAFILGNMHVETICVTQRQVEPKISNLDSSDQSTDFHWSNVHSLCFLAQTKLFCLLLFLSSGFLAAIWP